MTEAEILAQISGIARRVVGHAAALNSELRLVEDLQLDSVKALSLAVEVENHFRIVITPEAEAAIVTVGDLVRVVGRAVDDAG